MSIKLKLIMAAFSLSTSFLHSQTLQGNIDYDDYTACQTLGYTDETCQELVNLFLGSDYQETETIYKNAVIFFNALTDFRSQTLFKMFLESYSEEEQLIKIYQKLVEHGFNIEAANLNQQTMLIFAALQGYTNITKLLIEKRANTEAVDIYGNSAIVNACKSGHLQVVALLIENSEMIDAVDRYGNTLLILAIRNKYFKLAQYLIEQSADVNKKGGWDNTALIVAVSVYNKDIITYLVQNNADTQAENKWARTPLITAVAVGQSETAEALNVIEHLAKLGFDMDHPNKHGDTALMIASTLGYLGIVQTLVENGADVNTTNSNIMNSSNTAIKMASERGHSNIVHYLRSKGAH